MYESNSTCKLLYKFNEHLGHYIDYQIINGILNGQLSQVDQKNPQQQRDQFQNFQTERQQDGAQIVLNYNGLSEWQHFNGTSLNQGCGSVNNQNGGDTSANPLAANF